MSEWLGRGESRPWPTQWPVSSLGALLIAVAVGIGIFTFQNVTMWTPLQRWYWVEYLNTQVFPTTAIKPGNSQLLVKIDRKGKQQLAVDTEVVPGPQQGWPPFPFALTEKAREAGAVELKLETLRFTSQQVHKTLSDWIYEGQTPDDLLRPAWIGALGIFVLGLVTRTAIPSLTRRAAASPGTSKTGWFKQRIPV